MPGYEAKFVNPLLKRHECPICLFAMKVPVQTECGHLFCKECLEPVLKRRRPICPLDQEDIIAENVFPDNACRREINQLEVYCNFKSGGCPWKGHLRELQSHLKSCEYREFQCTQCGQYIRYNLLDQHKEKECPMRPSTCPHCKKEVPYQQLEDHIYHKCQVAEHLCPNGCNPTKKMKIVDLEKHLSVKYGDCPLSDVGCPYNPYGCSFTSTRKDMKDHMEQYELYHAQIQADSFMELKQLSEKNAASLQHLLERANSLEVRMTTAEKLQAGLDQKLESVDESQNIVSRQHGKLEHLEIQDMKKTADIVELGHKLEEMQIEVNIMKSSSYGNTGLTSGYGTAEYSHHSANVGAMSNPSQSIVTPLGPDFTRPSASLGNPIHSSNQRIESLHSRLVELEHSVDRSLSSCLDQELRIQLLERATYNGILLWKVDEFARRRKEAKEGVTMSLYSTPFYTGRHGYKMCARIYLNGDGLGKNTHMSFFFVVMRGPIDELLPWPFKQKVTLTLINQAGKKHVTDSFRPDPNSSSFQRPGRREMNIASGCPMFIRLEHLLDGGFVKDDCIYLRVMVDTADIPKVLPM